jgi:hypothetical protein
MRTVVISVRRRASVASQFTKDVAPRCRLLEHGRGRPRRFDAIWIGRTIGVDDLVIVR